MVTAVVKINSENPEKEKIQAAASVLRQGGLVAFPTETVYGLGANLLDKKAIERLYDVKKRPPEKPFSIHIAKKEQVEEFTYGNPPLVYKLIDKFWPGPLTIILKSKKNGKIGLRMPKNKIALFIIEKAGVPIVCPSANLSRSPAPVDIQGVLKDLYGLIEMAIDGGKTELGIESTVLDLTESPYQILRDGAVKKEEIDKISKLKNILFVCTGNSCRSVMAKNLLEKMLVNRDDIEIDAAGTAAPAGMGASMDTAQLLMKEGIDVSQHKARLVNDEMIRRADLILVMEKHHEEFIVNRVPGAENRVYLLKEFAKIDEADLNIIDPIGKPQDVYQMVFDTIKEAAKRVAEII